MYLIHPLIAKAVTRYPSLAYPYLGKFSFLTDITGRNRLPPINHLSQGVTMLVLPTHKEKAAVAAAAPSAHMSVLQANSIVPLHRRNAMGFGSNLQPFPLQYRKLSLWQRGP